MVFYRKYRPQTIEELDSKEIREKLHSILSNPTSVSHAFLFTGPKGLGKTSTARILAKAVNCEKISNLKTQKSKPQLKSKNLETKDQKLKTNDQVEPCNQCNQCDSITNGTNLDVLEIDGASNRGIDEIRELREKVKLTPVAAAKKVYIIDEVHMLTTEAFNALLKTLEEPPAHAMFILCTTEPHKIPATIFSRCLHLVFRKATEEELSRSFTRIIEAEKLSVDSDAISYIASLSDGSFRDGVKILEELVPLSAANNKITKEILEKKYQISNIKTHIEKMLKFLVERNTKESLILVSELTEQGIDMKYFLEQIINELHATLLIIVGAEVVNENVFVGINKAGPAARQPQNLPTALASAGPHSVAPRLASPASGFQKFNIQEIKTLMELLTKAYGELKYAVLPQLPLEIAVIEWSEKEENVLRSPSQFAKSSDASIPAVTSGDLGTRSPSATLMKTLAHEKAPRTFYDEDKSGGKKDLLQELIERLKLTNQSIAGILRGCSLKSFEEEKLTLETKYKFHKEKLEERKTQEILVKTAEELAGQKVAVNIILKDR